MISKELFAVNLGDYTKEDQDSSITLGGYDSSAFVGDLKEFKINTANWWAPALNGFYYGEETLALYDDMRAYAIVDTGTSLLMVPVDFYQSLKDKWKAALPKDVTMLQIPGSGVLLNRKCEALEKYFEPITFQIGDSMIELKPKGFLMNVIGPDVGMDCLVMVSYSVMVLGTAKHIFLLGDTVLRHIYQVYNYETNTVSLAVNKHSQSIARIY